MNWKMLYQFRPTQKMSWYYPSLDPDLEEALNNYKIHNGTFLDIGTGAGTQAVELAQKGFKVTGTDISGAAIKKASQLSDSVKFVQDDILNTKLTESFDYIFDRGCFHNLDEKLWPVYIRNITRMLRPDGYFFLKCLSDKQGKIRVGPFRFPENRGPKRFSPEKIKDIFANHFDISAIYDAGYQGNIKELPKALFIIMRGSN